MPDLFLYGPFLQEKSALCSGFLGSIEFQFLSSQTSKAVVVLDFYFFSVSAMPLENWQMPWREYMGDI